MGREKWRVMGRRKNRNRDTDRGKAGGTRKEENINGEHSKGKVGEREEAKRKWRYWQGKGGGGRREECKKGECHAAGTEFRRDED